MLAFPFVICTLVMIVRLLSFLFNDVREGIEPLLKSYVWLMKHPIKMIKMGLDQTFIRFMWLDDWLFKMIAKRKYKGYMKRMKRVPYEDESEKEWMEGTMKSFGDVLQHTSKCLDIGPSFMYAPRRVVYKDFDQYWKMIL